MAVADFAHMSVENLPVLETPLLRACTACEKAGRGHQCSSTNDHFARGKERSYVSTLETRVEKLQKRLEEIKGRKSTLISPADQDNAPTRRPSLAVLTARTPRGARAARLQEAQNIDDLVSDFGILSVNATARDFYGFTSAMSYARLILSACTKDPLPSGMTMDLPPKHAATPLIQLYLTNISVLLPILDEATFYASVDAVYRQDARTASPYDRWSVRMVLAIASLSRSQQRGDQFYLDAVGHVNAALEYAEQVLHPGSILSVQALLLLVGYAMLDPHHFDSWSLIGAASRNMVDLGLHQDPARGTPISKAKLELRRRVYYCVYALDRSTSLVQTRAFSFSDDSANVSLPSSTSAFSLASSPAATGQQTGWLQGFSHVCDLFRLRMIQSVWYTDLFQSGRTPWVDPYPYIWRTCDYMKNWFDNLLPTTGDSLRSFFELEMLYSYIYILSPSPRIPTIAPFAQNLIFEYAIQYAGKLYALNVDPKYTAPVTFYDAMRVYMTGRQFLDVLWNNKERLLYGQASEPPQVHLDSPPPPSLPRPSSSQNNIVRSIDCIKQLTHCLGRFGMRWGFMSWRDRFQGDAEPMMNVLNQLLRELEDQNSARGSSRQRSTLPDSVSPQQTEPQQHRHNTSSPQHHGASPSYMQQQMQPQQRPQMYQQPQYQQQQLLQSQYQQPLPSQAHDQQYQQPQMFQFQQAPPFGQIPPHQQNFVYNPSHPPSEQFPTWQGMGGGNAGAH
ncbi:hypothetical protein LTR66_010775 [Elasticomyces elasticus]|nr:hypothetical protein LTR66_010775 [Elasticomyces elasticus]